MEYTKLDVEKIMTLNPETKEIVVPEGVAEIGEEAFIDARNTLEKVVLPDSVVKIGKQAFAFCQKLTAIDLPKGLTEIPNSAFSHCSSLKEIEIPAGVKKINSEAFGSAALESIELPSGLEEIGYRAFFKCKLTAIELPQSLKKIESSAFSGNNIESVAFPSGIEKIGGFDCTPLKSVEIPDGVSEIGRFAFASCKTLESVKLPKELIYKEEKYIGWQNKEETRILGGIGDSAFSGCEKLTSIELPENLSMIQSDLFEGCASLKTVKIPASVKQVNREAFKGCTALEEIEIPATVVRASENLFCNSGVKKLRWLSNTPINENALLDMTSLEEAELNAREIEKFTLCMTYENKDNKDKKCPLKKLTIGKDTEKIEDGAFASLKDLTEIIVDAENKKYAVDSGCLYAKGTKRLIRAIPVGEKDGKPLYQISDKVKAIGANAFPKTVENAVVEFLGKIEKVSDKAVDGFRKSNLKKEKTPDGATGGARTVYDAMNLVQAKAAKIESVKKAGADALILAALSDWQYGYDECDGYSPARKVYRVKLPFGASFIVNMKPKPTQKDAQTVFEKISSLKPFVDDEFALFEKLRELSEQSEMSLKPTSSGNGKYLIEFSGDRNSYNDSKNTFVSSEGVPSDSFIEKDIASFFAGTNLEYQILIMPKKDSDGNAKMPSVQIAIKKGDKIVVWKFREWRLFARGKDDNGNVRNYLDSRHGLQNIIALVQETLGDDIAAALALDKDIQRIATPFVITV